MMTTTNEIKTALKQLKRQHANEWLAFSSKLKSVAAGLSARTEEPIADDVTTEHFTKAGFTQAEADALVFVMTEECMGQPVDSVEMIERWFCYCAA